MDIVCYSPYFHACIICRIDVYTVVDMTQSLYSNRWNNLSQLFDFILHQIFSKLLLCHSTSYWNLPWSHLHFSCSTTDTTLYTLYGFMLVFSCIHQLIWHLFYYPHQKISLSLCSNHGQTFSCLSILWGCLQSSNLKLPYRLCMQSFC